MLRFPVFSTIVSLVAALAVASPSVAQKYEPPIAALPANVQWHMKMAYLLMNGDVSEKNIPMMFSGIATDPKIVKPPYNVMEDNKFQIATKAFDQLYFVGWNYNGAWALKTNQGIILFSTMATPQEAQDIIEGGFHKLGLDPRSIKYIVIDHAHKDHFGSAKYLQEKYHAHVLMNAAEWDMPPYPPQPAGALPISPMPRRDIDIVDGQQLSLGGQTVTLYVTPGHTPGSVSAIIPVTDHGQKHTLLLWGATGLPATLGPTPRSGGLRQYEASLWRVAKIGIDAGVDGLVAIHPIADGTDVKAALAAKRKAGEPNPWVIGQSTFIRYMGAFIESVQASIDYHESKGEQ
jgi:metallo-beta-lactamase class B